LEVGQSFRSAAGLLPGVLKAANLTDFNESRCYSQSWTPSGSSAAGQKPRPTSTRKVNMSIRSIAALAVCSIAVYVQAQSSKQLRPGEFELYDEAIKDLNSAAFAKAVGAIEVWEHKFPDSDYANDRAAFSVQAFAGANQPAKALDAAVPLFAKDLNTLFTGPEAQALTIRLLYNTTWAVSHTPNPGPEALATGEKAALALSEYDKSLPGVSEAKWAEARADMKAKAAAALLYIAMLPGMQAMAKQPPDCAAAAQAYTAALNVYPDRAALSYELGRVFSCRAKANPDQFPLAIYQFQRAAAIDATLGDPSNDSAKIRAYADKAYVQFHGSDDGLDQLKSLVKQSPLPPPDFKIQSAAEVADAIRTQFERDNPQLALWMNIRARLLEEDGSQYFENEMKGAALPRLKGILVEARPSCRPRELLVAVPLPDAAAPSRAEITLKLDKPLAGKPELNGWFEWEGLPQAFNRAPFMLTMSAETGGVLGLHVKPCTAPPRKGTAHE
jgi:hypothetical protein